MLFKNLSFVSLMWYVVGDIKKARVVMCALYAIPVKEPV